MNFAMGNTAKEDDGRTGRDMKMTSNGFIGSLGFYGAYGVCERDMKIFLERGIE